jgi:hypothetical protein
MTVARQMMVVARDAAGAAMAERDGGTVPATWSRWGDCLVNTRHERLVRTSAARRRAVIRDVNSCGDDALGGFGDTS